ncbi:hypothetical protein AVEN_108621-1 [Araneus ventricosus]|uniref:Uncharacterized protein n=1 Tax=Araneus ventricosus TaxID=182803 RepID=A0A4Y2DH03_ARAVE|nr:hypothetical protein AVEN_108621-1 [Araneus ventricosus]
MRGQYAQAANKHMMKIGSSVDYVKSGGMRNVPVTKAVEHLYATTAKFLGCVLLASCPVYSYPPRRSFENYLMMKNVFQDKDKCAQILLNSIRASNYNILAALIAPKATAKRSCLVSQHYFLSTDQKQDSSISEIENRYQKFKVDMGAGYTLILNNQFKRLGIKRQLEPTGIAFRSYTENVFLPLGKVRVKVEHKCHESFEDLYIVPDGFDLLLGRVWVRHFKINQNEID